MKRDLLLLAVCVLVSSSCFSSDYLVCRDEYKKYCHPMSWSEVEKEDYWCLRYKLDDLSIKCQALIFKKSQDDCLKDTVKFCKKGEMSLTTRERCLEREALKLSKSCRQEIEMQNKRMSSLLEYCGTDYKKHCPGLTGQALLDCSETQYFKSVFSVGCKKHLEERFPMLLKL